MTSSAPTYSQMWRVFGKIGLLSFGGPAAQISLMHRMLVEEKGWLSERQYLSALSFCMLLPGPEAMQLATYAGWRLRGVWGGLLAGLLFVVPGACVILALGLTYVSFGDLGLMQTLFLGVKAAVLVIVVEALLRVAKRALKTRLHWLIAVFSFVAIFFFSLPYPLIVLVAALFGFVFITDKGNAENERPQVQASVFKTVFMVVVWVGIWLLPIALIDQLFATQVLVEIGQFFSKLAVVTFGGAYAVLAYMTQDVVHQFGWLSTGEMMDGLGLAETTPGHNPRACFIRGTRVVRDAVGFLIVG